MNKLATQYLTVKEVAEHCRASVQGVRRWLAEGRLPYTKPGKHILIAARDLDAFLDQHRVEEVA